MRDSRVAGGGGRPIRPLVGVLVAAALVQGLPAAAQGTSAPPPAAAAADQGVLAASMRVLGDGWSDLKDGAAAAWDTAASVFLPAVPSGHLPERQSERTRVFFELMELAGYRLAKIETGGMILSHVRYEFEQERRLTADDAERVRRAIARHEAQQTGISAAYHRWIARSVLDAALSDEFRVAAVQVTMRPVPSLEFRTVAVDRPLDETERRLVHELRPAGNGGPR
ncbi:hypothetical protein [Stella sp.]|uniref:hypothetical protein n=1 Tax=Stella sp. TaxID=2912054 RepID=UPI0035B4127E